jgi:hypothetical protein
MDPDADPRDQKLWILRIRMRIRNADAANVYNALASKIIQVQEKEGCGFDSYLIEYRNFFKKEMADSYDIKAVSPPPLKASAVSGSIQTGKRIDTPIFLASYECENMAKHISTSSIFYQCLIPFKPNA